VLMAPPEALGGGDVDDVPLEAEPVDEVDTYGFSDLLDVQWQSDIKSLANLLLPIGFITFLRAGKPDGLGGDDALLLQQKCLFLFISIICLGFNVLCRSNLALFRRHWQTISCFAIWLLVTLFCAARATREVRGAYATSRMFARARARATKI